jgi:hypothetical protein
MRPLTLPKNWALTNATFHFVGEDLSKDKNPFAATITSQLRLDARAAGTIENLARADQLKLEAALPSFKVLHDGEITLKRHTFEHLEFTFQDPGGRQMHQIVYYCQVGDEVYSVTGVHVAGDRFEKIRPQVADVAVGLVSSNQ